MIGHFLPERTGKPTISSLELITRYTSLLWATANREAIRPRPGVMLPPVCSDTDMVNAEVEFLFRRCILYRLIYCSVRRTRLCLRSICNNFLNLSLNGRSGENKMGCVV